MLKIWPLIRCKCSIENVNVVIVVKFENKKWLLERNDKERLKNNILIKWYDIIDKIAFWDDKIG